MAQLILALDLPDRETALAFLDRVPEVTWVKVGSILFTREGPGLIQALRDRGKRIFLDLKWHDIPNTVREAVASARALEVDMVTVHALGGAEMMAAAAEGAAGALDVVAVTVLTSHSVSGYLQATGREDVDLLAEVVRQAEHALSAGLAGVVCSPREVSVVRGALGTEALVVVPGIRRAADPADDQTRTASAGEAVRAGASHLVVGRPVLRASDPRRAWSELSEEGGT